MITSQYPGYQGNPFGGLGGFGGYGGFSNNAGPGTVDVNGLSASVAQGLAQSLAQTAPAPFGNALSGQPQIPGNNFNPQSLINFQANTPFGGLGLGLFDHQPQLAGLNAGANAGANLAPQGFNVDFGNIIKTIAQSAAQALPGLLISLLSAHPQLQQLTRQGGAGGGNLAPQSLINVGANTPFGGFGIGLFDNKPQVGVQPGAGAGFAPQGFNLDFGSIIHTIAQTAAQALPGLLISLLSSHPQLQQLAGQANVGGAGGVAPQSLINFGANTPLGGFGIGLFDNKPQLGTQFGAGVAPQGIDFGEIIRNVAQNAAQALPTLLTNVLATLPQTQQLAAHGIDLGAIVRNAASILAPQIPNLVHHVLGGVLRGTATLH